MGTPVLNRMATSGHGILCDRIGLEYVDLFFFTFAMDFGEPVCVTCQETAENAIYRYCFDSSKIKAFSCIDHFGDITCIKQYQKRNTKPSENEASERLNTHQAQIQDLVETRTSGALDQVEGTAAWSLQNLATVLSLNACDLSNPKHEDQTTYQHLYHGGF